MNNKDLCERTSQPTRQIFTLCVACIVYCRPVGFLELLELENAAVLKGYDYEITMDNKKENDIFIFKCSSYN